MRAIFVLCYFTELCMVHFIAIEENLLFPCKTKVFTVYTILLIAYRVNLSPENLIRLEEETWARVTANVEFYP